MGGSERPASGQAQEELNEIIINPDAVLDVEDAANWYESQEPGLGIEFLLELDSAIDLAAEAPDHYEVLYQGVRRVLLQRFPFSVYFVSNIQVIEIIAVLHQHRAPFSWQSRI